MNRLPALGPGVVGAFLGPSAVVFEPAEARLHILNPAASLLFDACEQGWSLDALVGDVAAASGVAPEVVAADIENGLADFRRTGLVTGTDNETPHDVAGPDVARQNDEAPEPNRSPELSPYSGTGSTRPTGAGRTADSPLDPGRDRVSMATPVAHRAVFRVLDEVVELRSEDQGLVAAAADLLGDLIVEGDATVEWSAPVGLGGAIALSGPGLADTHFANQTGLLDALPTLLNQVAVVSTTCLALHAGAVVAPDGRVLVLPAVSGSGKSTLTAALVQAGWGYLSDEAVGIRAETLEVVSYPKPLVVDASSREVLGLLPDGSPNVRVRDLADAATVGTDDLVVCGVLLPTFRPGAPVGFEQLSPEQAVLAIAEHALNLRSSAQIGVSALVELADRVPCHRLVHGGVADAVPAIVAAWSGDPAAPRVLVRSDR